MIYHYKCEKCKKKVDVDIPMGQDLPKDLKCECNGLLRHDFVSQIKTQSLEIPQNFQACSRYAPRIKYKKDAATENCN